MTLFEFSFKKKKTHSTGEGVKNQVKMHKTLRTIIEDKRGNCSFFFTV